MNAQAGFFDHRFVEHKIDHRVEVEILDALSERPLSTKGQSVSLRNTLKHTIKYYVYAITLTIIAFSAFSIAEYSVETSFSLRSLITASIFCLWVSGLNRKVYLRFSKRVFDIILSAIALVTLSPLLLAIAAIVMSDGGPAFFQHTRVGKSGKPFKCLKFRTMVVDSESELRKLLVRDPSARQQWAERKLRNDPRLTRIGFWLRITSLDEIPQLFNVLRGDMSLVGPRAAVEFELSTLYREDAPKYTSVRPGLTGIAQVAYRRFHSNRVDIGPDLEYIRVASMWMDFRILVSTISAVFRGSTPF